MTIAWKVGSWISATFVIFTALVWLIGGFLVTSVAPGNVDNLGGLATIPNVFWPIRAVISALGVVGVIILVLSRPAFFRVLAVWFGAEIMLIAWLYFAGSLSSQFDNFDSVRNLVILQMCNFSVVLFALMKHNVLYQSEVLQE